MNPIVNSLSELLERLQKDVLNNDIGLYITDRGNENSLFEELLVQELLRVVNSKEESFLAIRNIVLKKQYQSLGLFTEFLEVLEKLNVNLMFHDVVNKKLFSFLQKRGYKQFFEVKSGHDVTSLYKLKVSKMLDCD